VVNTATISKPNTHPNSEQSNRDHRGWETAHWHTYYQLQRKLVNGHNNVRNLYAMCEETRAEHEENFEKITQSRIWSQIQSLSESLCTLRHRMENLVRDCPVFGDRGPPKILIWNINLLP
jgi:hypothetical protein